MTRIWIIILLRSRVANVVHDFCVHLLLVFRGRTKWHQRLSTVSSVEIFIDTKYLSCSLSRTMNGVPGVMQLESNLASFGSVSPFRFASAYGLQPLLLIEIDALFVGSSWPRSDTINSHKEYFTWLDCAEEKLKITEDILEYLPSEILKWTSSSFGCEQTWIIPFMSRYKLSNSGI